ncbi:MAG: hypothetical protein P8Z80_01465, partial [Pseudolabrys sp.]
IKPSDFFSDQIRNCPRFFGSYYPIHQTGQYKVVRKSVQVRQHSLSVWNTSIEPVRRAAQLQATLCFANKV